MSSWILDYVQAIDSVSESPIQFNIWAAISVVSATLKNNVHIKYKTFDIYPNQFIVLVAPPGIGKGTAIHPAHDFAKEAKLVNYLSDRVTAPRIIEKLFQGFSSIPTVVNGQVLPGGKDSSVTLMSAELPTLLTSSDWMLQFLCDAWDRGSFDYDTKNKGSFTVTDMCVSLIGACVPDYIKKLNKDSFASVSSGFTARTIFVYADKKSKSLPWGEGLKGNPKYSSLILDLESRLRTIANLKGEYTLDYHAQQRWNDFYSSLNFLEDDSEAYKYFRSRQHVHVLKTSMALAAAESPDLVITRAILEKAISLVENIAEGVDEIFRGVGESDIASAVARLQIYIERKGTVSLAHILKDNVRFINPSDIVKVLGVLEAIGFATVAGNGYTCVYTHTGQSIGRVPTSHTANNAHTILNVSTTINTSKGKVTI